MLVRVGQQQYLLPTIAIQRSFRAEHGAVSTVIGRGEVAMLHNRLYPLFRLHELFNIEGAVTDPDHAMVILLEEQARRALMVDEYSGQQQAVIKSLGKALTNVPGVAGGAILGDGRVGFILDTVDLYAYAWPRRVAATHPSTRAGITKRNKNDDPQQPRPRESTMTAHATLDKKDVRQTAGKYLTFMLADEQYGIEILKVIEIVGMMETTSVPRMPPFVKGVANLRGRIVPVVDLRLQLGMPEGEHVSRRCMVVVAAGCGESGILVDKVLEVLNISADEVEDPHVRRRRQCRIHWWRKTDGCITILLDIERILKEASPTQP